MGTIKNTEKNITKENINNKYINLCIKNDIKSNSDIDQDNLSFTRSIIMKNGLDENKKDNKDNKDDKEISLYGQILEREREREKEKEIESRRFHKIEGNFVPKSNISFDLDFDSKSFIPKKKIKSGDKKKDNALVASLVSHYNKQLLELKEMAKKKDKNSDDKSYEGSSYYGESSESGDSSYVSESTENEGEKSNNKEKNKIMTDEMINDYSELNQFEQELQGEIDFLNQKLISNQDNHENNLQIINNNTNLQLNNIKERESFIVKQSEQITAGLKKVANQKQNAVDLLKNENQHLKNRNKIINTKL